MLTITRSVLYRFRCLPVWRVITTVICFLLFARHAAAGWWITEQKDDRFGNKAIQSIFIEGSQVRIEHQTSTFIFDVSQRHVTVIFPRQMVFWQGVADTLKQGFIRSVEQQMLMLIAEMPEHEQEKARPEFERMVNSLRHPVVDTALFSRFQLVKRDSVMQISGFPSEHFHLLFDTAVVEQLWFTQAVQPYAGISLDTLQALMQLFSRPSLLGAARESPAWKSLAANGLLMRSVVKTDIGEHVMEVTQVKKLPIREDFFLPPPGYRLVTTEEAVQIMLGENHGPSNPSSLPDADTWKPMLPKPVTKDRAVKPPSQSTMPEMD